MPEPTLAYDEFAVFYDATAPDRGPELAFYRGLLTRATRSLLDLGCGTGALTAALAGTLRAHAPSARIVGLDGSQAMLDIARGRDAGVEWVCGDLLRPPVAGCFDLVLCCFNTLQIAAPDDADLRLAFASARCRTAPSGRFAFDIYQPNPDALAAGLGGGIVRRFEVGAQRLAVRQHGRYDPDTRRLTVDWTVVDRDREDAPALAALRSVLRQYSRAEIEGLLEATGWRIAARFGDYDGRPFDACSRKQLVVCAHA